MNHAAQRIHVHVRKLCKEVQREHNSCTALITKDIVTKNGWKS